MSKYVYIYTSTVNKKNWPVNIYMSNRCFQFPVKQRLRDDCDAKQYKIRSGSYT